MEKSSQSAVPDKRSAQNGKGKAQAGKGEKHLSGHRGQGIRPHPRKLIARKHRQIAREKRRAGPGPIAEELGGRRHTPDCSKKTRPSIEEENEKRRKDKDKGKGETYRFFGGRSEAGRARHQAKKEKGRALRLKPFEGGSVHESTRNWKRQRRENRERADTRASNPRRHPRRRSSAGSRKGKQRKSRRGALGGNGEQGDLRLQG